MKGLDWKMIGGGVQNRRFTTPVEWPKLWAVVIVQNCVQMDQCQYVMGIFNIFKNEFKAFL